MNITTLKKLQEAHTQKLRQMEPPGFLFEILQSVFPQLYQSMNNATWHKLIVDFFQQHPIKTPIMHEIPDEFVEWLYHHTDKKQFELGHFEWLEVALSFDNTDLNKAPLPSNSIAQVSPLAHLMYYETFEKPYWIVWRNRTHQVAYLPVDLFSAKFFELLKKNTTLSVQAVLKQLAEETGQSEPSDIEKIEKNGLALLDEWRSKEIILE